ncbi:MAG: glycosyltransferase family 4 protein [Verrucomicrobiota bacterium]
MQTTSPPIHLALPSGSNYGWGLCGSYLRKELSSKVTLTDPTSWDPARWAKKVDGICFHALEGASLKSWIPLRGNKNFGYVFFENDLNPDATQQALDYNLVLAGSTWCQERMAECGIANTGVLIQGVDTDLFYPLDDKGDDGDFVLFSGGKFEYRKGQDLVLAAFRILSQKYPRMRLITAWENQWSESMRTMHFSTLIEYIEMGETWLEKMHALYVRNGIDPQKVHTCPLLPNRKMRGIYAKTDLGIFPNRCEGGTNLVLMEYMACGKPVVASFSSGHQDILTEKNAFLIHKTRTAELKDQSGQFSAHWDDFSVDELVSQIEQAYHDHEKRRRIGVNAGESLKKWTWGRMADRVLDFVLEE